MSLIKQLWLGIIILVTLTFSSSVLISTYQNRDSYQEQLQLKNIDNATNLGLLLSHSEKDLIHLELLLAAQFDSGHYQYISLSTADDNTLIRFDTEVSEHQAPTWFKRLLNLQLNPGVAQIQDGWMQFGTLTLQSQYDYAVDALWLTTLALASWSFWVALIFGILASFALRFISKPLENVVNQAEALGQRRFISSKEPVTLEFRRVVKAMNILTHRVKDMLDTELQRTAELQEKSQKDPNLFCFNRGYMLSWLSNFYASSADVESKTAILFRIHQLADINTLLGREKTDTLLRSMLNIISTTSKDSVVGRLNGSDFLAIIPFSEDKDDAFSNLHEALEAKLHLEVGLNKMQLSCVASDLAGAKSKEECLSQLDTLLSDLAVSAMSGCKRQHILLPQAHGSNYWRQAIYPALERQYTVPRAFPVLKMDSSFLHNKLFLQLEIENTLMSASRVIGWIKRFGWMDKVDLLMCKTAIRLATDGDTVAVTLSEAVLGNESCFLQLISLLKQTPTEVRQRLVFEFSEEVALEHQLALKAIVMAFKPLGLRIGLVHCGHGLNKFNGLESLALDYLKIDAAIIGQYEDEQVQRLLISLIQLGKALGAEVIADGVTSEQALKSLGQLGFYAVAGPVVILPPKA